MAELEPSRSHSKRVFEHIELDAYGNPTGQRLSLLGAQFRPLQYADLVSQKLSGRIDIPLIWESAEIIESTYPDLPVGSLSSGSSKLQSTYSSSTIGLVQGGWLPAGLALHDDMLVMPDRCTISELTGRFNNGTVRPGRNPDFLDFFANRTFRISPLLYALEGNVRDNPTPELLKQQLEEACTKIMSCLPLAKLTPSAATGLSGLMGIITDTQSGMQKKRYFLEKIAPDIKDPVSIKRRPLLWKKVLTTADQFDIPRRSLVVIAALSAICVPNRSPAKALLKLTADRYSAELAYNALADLRALEILMHLFALYPHERFLLCTGDKDLALFWAGIRASDFTWIDEHLEFKLSPIEALLPNITAEQRDAYFDSANAN